ncbi:MAG TPA: hypothetical protein VJ836_00945 [Candidatus Saccharimonadales bacterium]|nr:hypothetical protein [Candidatus Saccharimonadales bacterium]
MIAATVLPPDAEEVVILAAVPAYGALHDESPRATGTPHQALEIVVVCAVTDARALVRIKYPLHPFKQRLGDQCFVSPFVFDAFVRDIAAVVAVTKHAA